MATPRPNAKCAGCRALTTQVEKLTALVSRLEMKIERLEAKLRQNSSSSHRPPSSDPPWSRPSGKAPSGRPRGGQPGHEKSERKLLPPDEVDELHCCKPSACDGCGAPLTGCDPDPVRHQVTEIPPIRPVVTEWQLHALQCESCGVSTRARLPGGVPLGAFGPRVQALAVLLTGAYRISRRNVCQVMSDCFGVDMSLGALSKLEGKTAEALEEPFEGALDAMRKQPVVHPDETSWREAGKKSWMWTVASKAATVFLIRPSRGSDVAKELLGEEFAGTTVSDRWSGYNWLDIHRRQVCWAHLIRDFRKIAESSGDARVIGESLEGCAGELFEYWHRVRDGTLARSTFARHASRIRKNVRRLLEQGASLSSWRAPGLCRGILALEPAMWTFVRKDGVEPTNNVAERAIRPAVIWRKTSLGTQSGRGSRFVERMLTCVATLRQQGRNVLDYLTATCEAAQLDICGPKLIA
jgi:transposase